MKPFGMRGRAARRVALFGSALAAASISTGGCARRGGPLIGLASGVTPVDSTVPPAPVTTWRTLPQPFWVPQPAPAASGASLRGVRAVDARVAWASGSGGAVLRTTDGGATWRRRPVPGADSLDFRSVWAFDSLTAVVASAGEAAAGQARLYRTADGGRTWALARQDTTRGIFYDAIAFWDRDHGLVLSDPVAGRFVVLATNDGGRSWHQTPREGLPDALPGEAAFAAGNAALAVVDDTRAWFVTGGPNGARVYTTTTGGARWDAVPAPRSDRAGRAPGSLPWRGCRAVAEPRSAPRSARAHSKRAPAPALAVGGDYRAPRTGTGQIVRAPAGAQWLRADVGGTAPGYWSGLAYVPGLPATAVAVGGGGTAVTRDDGRTWTVVDSAGWNAVSFARPGAGWAVGSGGRIGKVGG